MLCLVGPPGIGKTRLLSAARERAAHLGLAVAGTLCWADGAPPLWPWLDLLTQLAPPGGEPDPALAGPPGGFAAFRSVERAVTTAATRSPVLLTLDDLQYGDEATILLARYLASRVQGLPVVLLLAHRPPVPGTATAGERTGQLLADVDRAGEVLDLPPLAADAVADLAAAHGRPGLSAADVEALTAAGGGIPLYVLTALGAADGFPGFDLATAARGAVTQSLTLLPADHARTLARAAVLGSVVPVDVVARITGAPPGAVAAAVADARAVRLVPAGPPDRVDTGHELVRAALVGWLSDTDGADVGRTHAAAATHFAGPGSDPVRAARHALAAAAAGELDAATAVALARRGAAVLADGGSADDAIALLERAVAVDEDAGRPVSRARLLIDLAGVQLLGGRLAAANARYREAVEAALAERDAVVVAEATAGLGAPWVNTVRSPVEQRRTLLLQRSALADLPPGHDGLRLRLRARITAEAMFWEGASAGGLLEVLDDVRQSDDPETTLDVLSLVHHALLGPDHAAVRRELADRMLEVAAQVGGGILPLMALCWRAVDLFLAGDPLAGRALADLREQAEAMQTLSILYVVRVMEVMLLTRRGRLVEAEDAAARALELGTRAQDADAVSYYGGQLVAVRWFQGREGEVLDLLEQIAGSAALDVVDHSFEAGAAALAVRAGRRDVARGYLDRVTRAGLKALPRFSTWTATMISIIEAAQGLADQRTLAEAYDLLEPFGELPVMPSLAVTCFGVAAHWLGVAAAALGRDADAEEHLRAAVEGNLRLGHEPATAVSRAELARLLGARPSADARAEARSLLAEALEAADRLGLGVLADRWRAGGARLDVQPKVRLERTPEGDWTVGYGGRQVRVGHRVGMTYLAALTGAPGHWVAAADLVGGAGTGARERSGGDPQPLLDQPARRSLERRVRELADHVTRARESGDLTRQAAAEEELDVVAGYLAAATGLGGRDRGFTTGEERARTAVRKAVVRAVVEIARQHPEAAEHLRERVTTGISCRYDP